MRRSLFLVATAIMVVLGTVMLVSAAMMQPAPLPLPATSDADAVHRFYAAINDVIATGDSSPVHAVVSPYFVARDPLPGVEADRSGLERYLVALHHVEPGLRLVPQVVTGTGDLVVTRVAVERDRVLPVLAGAISDPPPVWGAVDVLRVADGTIVERWGDSDGIGVLAPLAELSLDFPTPAPRVVTIDRFALDTGGRWTSRASGPHLLVVEEGALDVAVHEGNGAEPQAPRLQPDTPLSTGESMLMPAGAGFSMTNVASVTSRILVVTFAVPQSLADATAAEALPRDVIGQTLAGGIATDVRVGAASLQMRRITLGSGAQLAFTTTEGPILIAVDAGLLDIAASAPAWIRSGADGMNRQRRETTLAPGDGALLGSGGFATLRNGGADPVFALVLTLQAIPAATPIATST